MATFSFVRALFTHAYFQEICCNDDSRLTILTYPILPAASQELYGSNYLLNSGAAPPFKSTITASSLSARTAQYIGVQRSPSMAFTSAPYSITVL